MKNLYGSQFNLLNKLHRTLYFICGPTAVGKSSLALRLAKKIEGNYLEDVSISEFSSEFELINLIISKKVDISSSNWKVLNPRISSNNITKESDETYYISTHFDKKKISTLFRNLSSLNINQLQKLNKDYKSLGYSTAEIDSHINKLLSFPFYVSIMTVLSSIIMLNLKRNKSIIFHIILGILLSVTVYYLYFLFNLFGVNAKIPLLLSIWLPLLILTFFILIGLVRINEK